MGGPHLGTAWLENGLLNLVVFRAAGRCFLGEKCDGGSGVDESCRFYWYNWIREKIEFANIVSSTTSIFRESAGAPCQVGGTAGQPALKMLPLIVVCQVTPA